MDQVGYTNIHSKIKINGLLSNPFALMGGVHWGRPPVMLLHISEVIMYFQFSLMLTWV